MKSTIYGLLSAVLSAMLFIGCYKEEVSYTSDLDLVITNYQKDFNFNIKSTFALPDSIVLMGDVDFDGTNRFAKPVYADDILSVIRSNMTQNGWREVAKTANPDVIILPSVTQVNEVFYYASSRYWTWYYPNYYPNGWGWYYPDYYFPPSRANYKTGSLFIQLTDPSNSAASDQLPVVWTCIVNGLLQQNGANAHLRVVNTIGQAFKQSPCLKK
jgi:hypothetical protein